MLQFTFPRRLKTMTRLVNSILEKQCFGARLIQFVCDPGRVNVKDMILWILCTDLLLIFSLPCGNQLMERGWGADRGRAMLVSSGVMLVRRPQQLFSCIENREDWRCHRMSRLRATKCTISSELTLQPTFKSFRSQNYVLTVLLAPTGTRLIFLVIVLPSWPMGSCYAVAPLSSSRTGQPIIDTLWLILRSLG